MQRVDARLSLGAEEPLEAQNNFGGSLDVLGANKFIVRDGLRISGSPTTLDTVRPCPYAKNNTVLSGLAVPRILGLRAVIFSQVNEVDVSCTLPCTGSPLHGFYSARKVFLVRVRIHQRRRHDAANTPGERQLPAGTPGGVKTFHFVVRCHWRRLAWRGVGSLCLQRIIKCMKACIGHRLVTIDEPVASEWSRMEICELVKGQVGKVRIDGPLFFRTNGPWWRSEFNDALMIRQGARLGLRIIGLQRHHGTIVVVPVVLTASASWQRLFLFTDRRPTGLSQRREITVR
ncbi:hypothetical protein ENSA5_35900 [Enhygromyxa salina]|uniref:Uncharacterized protein n=1 Tax=Enhygromyxa salina TaxID=215803 RepID=A0A2S9XUK3_9BACT|nr:hypothetical protein ENSA5_35900 [Enhygromyxa salina]